MAEPKVIYATVRASINDDGEEAWDIECRFGDGQKFAPVVVDGNYPLLAHRIANALTLGDANKQEGNRMLIQLNDHCCAQAGDIIAVMVHRTEERVQAFVREVGPFDVNIMHGETKFERADKLRDIINLALGPIVVDLEDPEFAEVDGS